MKHINQQTDSLYLGRRRNFRKLLLVALCAFPGTLVVAQPITPGVHRQQLKGHLTEEMIKVPPEGKCTAHN